MADILVIDDDDNLRSVIRVSLEMAGHRVREAVDGSQGLELFRQRPADLVFCDIFMPNKEGLETIMELRRLHHDVKIISMSGGSNAFTNDFLQDSCLLGAAGVLRKPFDMEELLATVDAFTGH